MTRRAIAFGGFFAFALACALSPLACASNPPPQSAARVLDRRAGPWLPDNARRIDRLLAERGRSSARYDAAHPPVAVFDWDNTMMKNDIGDATFYWMLAHDVIRQPPERDWSRTSAELTDAARDALARACAAAAPGEPLATSRDAACAAELLAVFADGKTRDGASAWKHETTLTSHAPYAWGASLLAGYTHDELRAIARKVYEQNHAAPIGATQTIGARSVVGYVRIYDPMRDLVGALQANGFDVWIVSASAQPLAEIVAGEVGVAADHVIGVRTARDDGGRYAYALEPCGSNGDTVITFNQGKRCWINRVVFRRPPAEQLPRAADPALRPVFAAGDSDTDLAMVEDATELKLAINRNRVLLMCNAYANRGGRWLIQPMFIEPMPQRAEAYACADARDAAGAALRDEEGSAIADQRDSIFALP